MPIVQVIQNCIPAAREDFEEMCQDEIHQDAFSKMNAFARCTESKIGTLLI